jgi:hypothetical protein
MSRLQVYPSWQSRFIVRARNISRFQRAPLNDKLSREAPYLILEHNGLKFPVVSSVPAIPRRQARYVGRLAREKIEGTLTSLGIF